MKLHRDTVIRTALDLLQETGMDGLTTRRIATALGVQQPALYWHFKDKRALLDGLASAMMSENHTHVLPESGENWQTFLGNNARSFRRSLLAYRDGARIHAGSRPSPEQFSTVEAQIAFLAMQGLSVAHAAYALQAVGHYVVGSVLEQQAMPNDGDTQTPDIPSEKFPFLKAAFLKLAADGPDECFEYGLSAIISGLEQHDAGKATRRDVID